MFSATNFDKLGEAIALRDDVKPISYTEKQLDDLLNLKWIFFLLLALFSVEWFIRKRNGV